MGAVPGGRGKRWCGRFFLPGIIIKFVTSRDSCCFCAENS